MDARDQGTGPGIPGNDMGEFVPSYVNLYQAKVLEIRALRALEALSACRLCPRHCGANRLSEDVGVCRVGRQARVSSFHSHFGEESPLVGTGGSGTIFFSSCNLLCIFCQNYEVSHLMEGDPVDKHELADMMMSLQRRGCHNVNLVSPTHMVPQILEALIPAVEQGLNIPLVYNSGGYDEVETLRMLDGVIDLYMPDFKFWDNRWAERFCHVTDYRERVCAAIREMHRQVGDLVIDQDGIARRGLLVRHLVMPGGMAGTGDIMRFLAEEISPRTYVNIMAQYHPAGKAMTDPLIDRRISRKEFGLAVDAARHSGLRRLDGMRD